MLIYGTRINLYIYIYIYISFFGLISGCSEKVLFSELHLKKSAEVGPRHLSLRLRLPVRTSLRQGVGREFQLFIFLVGPAEFHVEFWKLHRRVVIYVIQIKILSFGGQEHLHTQKFFAFSEVVEDGSLIVLCIIL